MPSEQYSLKELKNNEIGPVKRLKIVEDLTEFPHEILDLKASLEILDLSNNALSSLPPEFKQLDNLKIVFLSNNKFTELPEVLGQCKNLEMIAFKGNKISKVAEYSLPPSVRWLILTDNEITELPDSMGQLTQLRKLALAGNRLTKLPAKMANCNELELVRLSANKLNTLPNWLFNLPKLAWLAFSGNPVCGPRSEALTLFPKNKLAEFELKEKLGEGASGEIFLAKPQVEGNSTVAIKLFKGDITSDGYPQDELDCCLNAGVHSNLVKTLAQINAVPSLGMVMELIPSSYRNLGLPPSLSSCTRDTFTSETAHHINNIYKLAQQMASVLAHLHENNVSHGDIYAHNSLINGQYHLLFGDFGAASQLHHLSEYQRDAVQAIEVRAFGYFVEDLLQVCSDSDEKYKETYLKLAKIVASCTSNVLKDRPKFLDLVGILGSE
ncbi:serine/threonine-protein kinase [Pseudoalteromonas sp. MMG013]|uniref:leucine-rich repeat-containing protein kinase family protein n=1 Tax=Pseudoalteromonas sp. MMG013 TaxID=2822687 RepID=UPI001B37B964|nr:leucine-rich repeat-containing protein kinase family protein [Pseudoalteromonas sp. MMG013]MBQ4860308.1 serine/threonine-protein kinase [Pseudoalteromonas sp. MMG013]